MKSLEQHRKEAKWEVALRARAGKSGAPVSRVCHVRPDSSWYRELTGRDSQLPESQWPESKP